jgi:hypothetical protein
MPMLNELWFKHIELSKFENWEQKYHQQTYKLALLNLFSNYIINMNI